MKTGRQKLTTESALRVSYFRLSEELQPYFTALYFFDVGCEPGEAIEDCLHPEWAAMRFTIEGTPPAGAIGDGPVEQRGRFVASGPTSRAIQFRLVRSRIWGLGLQPAGWAKFVDWPANELADTIVDGHTHPAFALFQPLLGHIGDHGADSEAAAERINSFLAEIAERPVPHERQILACQKLLRDSEIANVGELGERLGMNARALERLCARYFGFPPKLLLRRQRFLRSLAQFMLEPGRKWSAAIDSQYYDQAQFVRDFRSFMGMTPSEYAELPHPVLSVIIQQRMADQGAAPQTDLPTILRYRTD